MLKSDIVLSLPMLNPFAVLNDSAINEPLKFPMIEPTRAVVVIFVPTLIATLVSIVLSMEIKPISA